MRKKTLFLLISIIGLFILYNISAPQSNFFEHYKKNDIASKTLREFQNRKTKKITVNSVSWQYLSTGKGTKTIVFLHGMGGAYDLWWQQINYFENDFKIITYTLPDEIDNLNDALAGIKSILKEEKVDKFIAVGTSMGGYITQYILKSIPERVEKVVFGNTFPPNEDLLKDNLLKSKIIPFLPEIVISKLGDKTLKDKLLPAAKNDTLLACFLPSLPFSKKSFINRFKVVVDPFTINSTENKYKQISKLIIESDNDPLIPKKLRKEIKELYLNAKVYTFHNEGHFPYINASNEYNKVLDYFINDKTPKLK
ncbi:alpha/beta hydrolase [Polaribacter sp. MSW13]|uniref:Alpha/beta hydrolase n=1 Tax=Polaribacter marinus TaxID=2916838 RepID=A0A9X1VPH8_9FLAO|nr:alpha/beta hydrolase [Polaribacter marinus]MCI2228727.1 alpha/beta hydrolase [Polaribacter marinus]